MVLFLKLERLVIETKRGRKGLDAKRLGDELLIDIGRYGSHPDCRTLVCFVFDPTGFIAIQPRSSAICQPHGNLAVRVLIRPRNEFGRRTCSTWRRE